MRKFIIKLFNKTIDMMRLSAIAHRNRFGEYIFYLAVCCSAIFIVASIAVNNGYSAMQVLTERGIIKVRNDAPLKKNINTIKIKAARNEFEIAHIVIHADGSDIIVEDVIASDLVNGSKNISSSNIRIYREGYLPVAKRSNIEGQSGNWPDILLPQIDMYYREKRSAFPIKVVSSKNQQILVEVYVPCDSTPGVYKGVITIKTKGQQEATVPLSLEVFNFELPSTSSLETSYSISALGIAKGFTKGVGYNEPEIFKLMLQDLLVHRISPRVVSLQSTAPYKRTSNGLLEINWSEWDDYWGPFFNGTALNKLNVLPGARITTWNVNVDIIPEQDQVTFANEQINHIRSKGWKTFLYRKIFDEPNKNQFNLVHRELDRWEKAIPDLPLMVTTPHYKEFEGEVTLWCDVINFIHRFDDLSERGNRDNYFPGRLQKGEKLWWYQSCMSTGCFLEGGQPAGIGWPSMAIDHQGIYQRIMSWITWKYQIGGELYYDVATNWSAWNGKDGSKNDPWINFDYFHLNGDGRLFYPGTIDKIGGKHPIPLQSLRLKYLRDGYEDYEYFVIMKKMGLESELVRLINSIVKRNNDWQKNPEKLLEVRDLMGKLISDRQSKSNELKNEQRKGI